MFQTLNNMKKKKINEKIYDVQLNHVVKGYMSTKIRMHYSYVVLWSVYIEHIS